jgi:3-dehydroquinate dehydratase / shikimate dehydrogenase
VRGHPGRLAGGAGGAGRGALADSKFLEFRLDSLPKPAAALPQLKEFLAEHRDVTAIATCRRKEFGGNFAGSLDGGA